MADHVSLKVTQFLRQRGPKFTLPPRGSSVLLGFEHTLRSFDLHAKYARTLAQYKQTARCTIDNCTDHIQLDSAGGPYFFSFCDFDLVLRALVQGDDPAWIAWCHTVVVIDDVPQILWDLLLALPPTVTSSLFKCLTQNIWLYAAGDNRAPLTSATPLPLTSIINALASHLPLSVPYQEVSDDNDPPTTSLGESLITRVLGPTLVTRAVTEQALALASVYTPDTPFQNTYIYGAIAASTSRPTDRVLVDSLPDMHLYLSNIFAHYAGPYTNLLHHNLRHPGAPLQSEIHAPIPLTHARVPALDLFRAIAFDLGQAELLETLTLTHPDHDVLIFPNASILDIRAFLSDGQSGGPLWQWMLSNATSRSGGSAGPSPLGSAGPSPLILDNGIVCAVPRALVKMQAEGAALFGLLASPPRNTHRQPVYATLTRMWFSRDPEQLRWVLSILYLWLVTPSDPGAALAARAELTTAGLVAFCTGFIPDLVDALFVRPHPDIFLFLQGGDAAGRTLSRLISLILHLVHHTRDSQFAPIRNRREFHAELGDTDTSVWEKRGAGFKRLISWVTLIKSRLDASLTTPGHALALLSVLSMFYNPANPTQTHIPTLKGGSPLQNPMKGETPLQNPMKGETPLQNPCPGAGAMRLLFASIDFYILGATPAIAHLHLEDVISAQTAPATAAAADGAGGASFWMPHIPSPLLDDARISRNLLAAVIERPIAACAKTVLAGGTPHQRFHEQIIRVMKEYNRGE